VIITLIIILAFAAAIYFFMQQTKFGKMPSGERLNRIKKSSNYRDGSFQNINVTPNLTEGASYYKVIKEFFLIKANL